MEVVKKLINHTHLKVGRALQSMSGSAYTSAVYLSFFQLMFLSRSCDFILVCLVSFVSMILMVLEEERRRKNM